MSNKNLNSKNNWLYWLIAVVAVIALIVFISRNRNDAPDYAGAASDSTTVESHINNNWTGIDPNIPVANYEEVRDTDLQVRANDKYAVYSLKDVILFGPGKSEISSNGAEKLKRISASAEKRFPGGQVIIYGYADSTGTSIKNQKLSQQRAKSVKDWLVTSGNMNEERITLKSMGEVNPASSDTDEQGRLENRRVDIVVRQKQ
jgi:outer membrane protein OmpA-like peptidoglycan-associated protein